MDIRRRFEGLPHYVDVLRNLPLKGCISKKQLSRNPNLEVRDRPDQLGTSKIGFLADLGAGNTYFIKPPALSPYFQRVYDRPAFRTGGSDETTTIIDEVIP